LTRISEFSGVKGWLKRGVLVLGLAALAQLSTPQANAAALGFNGFYDYATWSATSDLAGPLTTVSSIDGSQQTLTLYEPDGCFSGGDCAPGGFQFSHTVGATGLVSFHWQFNWDIDPCCSGFNFYINSTAFNLAGDVTGGDASGDFSAPVSAGDVITFEAFTADNCCSAANTVITNFDAGVGPSGVPEPATVMLMGAGIAGLVVRRRLMNRRMES
jgi:hypothetical protein